jgi:hypothetical protein
MGKLLEKSVHISQNLVHISQKPPFILYPPELNSVLISSSSPHCHKFSNRPTSSVTRQNITSTPLTDKSQKLSIIWLLALLRSSLYFAVLAFPKKQNSISTSSQDQVSHCGAPTVRTPHVSVLSIDWTAPRPGGNRSDAV